MFHQNMAKQALSGNLKQIEIGETQVQAEQNIMKTWHVATPLYLKHSWQPHWLLSYFPSNLNHEWEQETETGEIPILPVEEPKKETNKENSAERQFSDLSEMQGFLHGVLSALLQAVTVATVNQMKQEVHQPGGNWTQE